MRRFVGECISKILVAGNNNNKDEATLNGDTSEDKIKQNTTKIS